MPHPSPISLRLRAMFGLLDTPADQPPPPALLHAADELHRSLLPGQLALITGPSGAGKSTLARALGPLCAPEARCRPDAVGPHAGLPVGAAVCPRERPHHAQPLDPTPADLLAGPLARRLRLLASVGLGDAHLFTRPLRHLSVGERARLDIATAIDRLNAHARLPTLILDELASTLDRPAAFRLCRLLRRWLARSPHVRVIALTAHDDLAPHLAPDIHLHVTPGPRINRIDHHPPSRGAPTTLPSPLAASHDGASPARREHAETPAPRSCADAADQIDAGRFIIDLGTLADYHALAPHHYRAGAPAVIAGPNAIRRAIDPRTAELLGVLVVSMPTLNAPWRDAIWPGRYRTREKRVDARRLRDELRCIARVIVAPEHRALGIAAALVRHYLADPLTPATEAIAAMGPASPFFARAGMRAYRLPPTRRDARLRDCLAFLGKTPTDLTLPPGPSTPLLVRELRRWASASRATRHLASDPRAIARRAAAALLAPPTVYAHVAPGATPTLSALTPEAPDADPPPPIAVQRAA